jgi:cyclase
MGIGRSVPVPFAFSVVAGCYITVANVTAGAIAVSAQQSPSLEVVPLDSGVYAAIRPGPLSLAVNSNSLFIVRDSDLVVVDAQFTRAATREMIAAIRTITDKPVGFVINTHWHGDHVAGDQVYRDSFPSARFVMQENTAADLPTLGAENRKNQVEGAPPVALRFERLLSLGLGIDSTPVSPLERTAVTRAIEIVRQYLKEAPGFLPVAATDTVRRRMTLGRGQDRIELLWFGYGNTRGDLVVHLPGRGIVASGDLVVAPIPFAFNSHPASWVGVMDSLLALKPKLLVPGHGPVMRDLSYVRSVRGWLNRINRETSAAVSRGDSLAAALETITLDDVRRQVTQDEKWMNFLFRNFFVRPAVAAAFENRRSGGRAVRRSLRSG